MTNDKELTKKTKNDLLASAGRSVAGIVPFAGPLLTELVDNLIPNQRIDRLIKYVYQLEKRLTDTEEENLKLKLKNEECIALFESGFIHASRATTDERRSYIASIVANGISDEEIEYQSSNYMLNLLSELNNEEVIWLRFFLHPTIGGDEDFREKHSNVLDHAPAYIGAPEKELDKSALQKSHREHLERLGLIQSNYDKNFDTGVPKFDKFTGKPKVTYRNVTHLGRMLLRQIDLLESADS